MPSAIEQRLQELGIELPTPAAPAANYVPFVKSGNLLFISGQVPMGRNGIEFVGKLGAGMEVEEGQRAARLCAINLLAQAKAAAGSLDQVLRCVKLTGFVNSAPDFGDQPKVVNGASDLMVDVLGEAGRHSRSAVGVAALPFGVAVEVEGIFEIE
ncbi:RidA family protein [Lutibaculum baratangense]|uniref:Endoribonuclease L-PSP n=1 Tax=Lutibaculum baratangense AMV1 TaxID=631454 RepID=V4RK03_9HYPH|nr:RidA family protein [Lutibaculum baratangense]ESR23585.1 Endoribonuclease L-PSP [Lutibaculum baratangense AMV1]